jgi:hypothetical protein
MSGCDYQGNEFGEDEYPNSNCIDGWLWDANSGDFGPDGRGWEYDIGGDTACPKCNVHAAKRKYG